MIGIVHYDTGNLGSLKNALDFLKIEYVVSSDQSVLSKSNSLILPGVGAFAPAMENLKDTQLIPFLQNWCNGGKPLLGICLGMQLLLNQSEEGKKTEGLGIIQGEVLKLKNSYRKIHMGWNKIVPAYPNLLLEDEGYGYFVHSYYCQTAQENILAETEYGQKFASIIRKDKVLGFQFHPEKSLQTGLTMIKKFANEEF